MIKSNMFKKLLISLLTIFAVLFIKTSYSHAATKHFSGLDELIQSKEFYCIQAGLPITEGTWVSGSTEVVSSDDGQPDRALAYILADAEKTGDTGYNGNGDHQVAVWHWYQEHSGKYYIREVDANSVYNEAINAPYINSNNSAELETGNLTVIEDTASLQVKNISGKINTVEIRFRDPINKQIYTQTITA